MDLIHELTSLLSFPKNVLILSHRNPDGDALGSSLGLSLYLQTLKHKVKVVLPSEYPVNFEWMPQTEEIITYDLNPKLAEEAIKEAELIFCLDFNSLDRIDKIGPLIQASTAPKVMIDHHIDPEPIADLLFSFDDRSSTSELVYEILMQAYPEKKIPGLVMDCLYTGILTDTGSFHHSTSARLFKILTYFKENGLDDTRIQELVLNSLPDKYLRLLGHCLHNRMELIPDWKFGLITLTREDYKNFDIQRGDTEGIINYLLMLKNVRIAALVMNQPTIVKLSLRSKGDISVQSLCKAHFNGGGHKNASGGSSKLNLEETIKKLKDVLPGYIFAAK
ncbi:MAG: bifunctional oligoribonuclease/PAP phosphatase NrnA [Bacteroidota bacterium]|nr:bifunctional oligoribonuclease/PAP phosphatase NrnA [Bacteroidota bacterium]